MVNTIKKIFLRIKSLLSGIFRYCFDYVRYLNLQRREKINISIRFFPKVSDRDISSHTFDKHYVYMDRWAFKHLLQDRPVEHIDVGSSIRFLSMASCVTKLKFVDIRPIKADFDNFECVEGSILNLPFADNSISSLSCLHVAEHIGLGRYGDPLDPLGTKKACKELQRILTPGGTLYFALPIGRETTYFNAHRVLDPQIVLKYFSGLKLIFFAAVNDDGCFLDPADINGFGQSHYACGMFLFKK